MLTIVGGIYYESCIQPKWTEYMGSAGRATSIVAKLNTKAKLISYSDATTKIIYQNKAALEDFEFSGIDVSQSSKFHYMHCLSTPYIEMSQRPYPPIKVDTEKVLCFGMIDGEAIINCDYGVYDPQNYKCPKHFHQNGSTVKHLAIILNVHEAKILSGEPKLNGENLIRKLVEQTSAEIVVLKQGPRGALLFYNSTYITIPSYITNNVWKIGSGDVFASYFANSWLVHGMNPIDSAYFASKATALYCNTQTFPSQTEIEKTSFIPARVSDRVQMGYRPKIYLAGPFFTLSQHWMIEQARKNLCSMNLEVFSPLHDVGRGPADQVVHRDLEGIKNCDVVFAIGDGLDSGTLYEIGYARALEKPVIFYAENVSEENMKMMRGSSCIISNDYATSIYRTAWEAISI